MKIQIRAAIRILTQIKVLAFLLALTGQTSASTFVSGNVSGTWAKTGSPYVATDNITVPPGQTLSIQPGVTFIIGQGLNVTVYGNIIANGTAAERVAIRGANSSLYWDKMYFYYIGGAQSSFVNCDISDATNAIHLYVGHTSTTMMPQIVNCAFSNCLDTCITGDVRPESDEYSPTLNGSIASCRFLSSSNGIRFMVGGYILTSNYKSQGSMNPSIANNLFWGLSGSGVWFDVSPEVLPLASVPKLVNNLFVQCGTGVQKVLSTPSFYDEISYNDFHNNQTNFSGYPPGIHGTICCQNINGTPSDLLFNIFQDPSFAETTKYTLSAGSACIDAGNPAGAYLDTHFPPSQGATVNDMGIFGGPYAGNWLTNAYNGTTNFLLTAQRYVGVTINPGPAGRYRLDSAPDVNNGPWTQVTNAVLLSTPWTWIDHDSPTTGKRFYRAVLLP